MRFVLRPLIGFLALSLLSTASFANNNSVSVTSAVAVQQPKKEGRKWSGFLNASRSTNLVDFQDGTRSDQMDYLARANYKLSSYLTLRGQIGYTQDLKYPESNDFSDTSFSVTTGTSPLGKRFLLSYQGSASLPTSKDSHKRQSLQTSLSGTVNVIVNPRLLIPGFSALGRISVARNIHQFETALDGRVNTQYSSSQSLIFAYDLTSKLSASATIGHRNTWSYQNVMRDAFSFSQEAEYAFNSSFAFAVGHSNSGSSLKPNGQDLNIQIMNENTSMIYASLTAIF